MTDEEIAPSLTYLEVVYELRREPGSLEWEEIKPRVERRLRYLFSRPERARQ